MNSDILSSLRRKALPPSSGLKSKQQAERSALLRNVDKLLPDYTASHPRDIWGISNYRYLSIPWIECRTVSKLCIAPGCHNLIRGFPEFGCAAKLPCVETCVARRPGLDREGMNLCLIEMINLLPWEDYCGREVSAIVMNVPALMSACVPWFHPRQSLCIAYLRQQLTESQSMKLS
jgi:hypothetical protein